MIIYFTATGYMCTHFKENHYSVELKNGSTIADFYNEIGRTMGNHFSKAIWNHDKNRFRGPVTIKIDGQIISREDYCLSDSQTIVISRLILGG